MRHDVDLCELENDLVGGVLVEACWNARVLSGEYCLILE